MQQRIQAVKQLYRTPDGFQDFPFTWAYDATQLATFPQISQALNQYVYILGGWGDFVMRRCVGLSTVVSKGEGGMYLIRDSQKRPLASDPTNISATFLDDLLFPNEIIYPETSIIGFDLYGINLNNAAISPEPLTEILQTQIAFQGVRRLPTALPAVEDSCDYDERTFTYRQDVTITNAGPIYSPGFGPAPPFPINPDGTVVQTITDYDFDLYQVIISYTSALSLPTVVTAVQLFDYAKNRISNMPLLDIFYNGAQGSTYKNGAMVPPLHYQQNTQIRLDFFSLSPNVPFTATVLFVGKQRYPRGTK